MFIFLFLYLSRFHVFLFFFFFNDTATTEIYTLSLHDALPISWPRPWWGERADRRGVAWRSEEHTSELQSRVDLVCRLLLEKKKKNTPHRSPQQNKKKPHKRAQEHDS